MSGGSHLAFGAVAGRGYAAVEGYGADPDPVVMLWHGARTSWTWTLLGQPAGQVGWPVGVAAAADPATGAAVPAVIALAGANEQYELWRSDPAGSWDRIGTPVANTLVRSVAGNVADPVTRPLAVVSGGGRRVWSVRVETGGPAWTELPALPSTVGDVVAGLTLDTPPETGYHVVTVGTDGRLWSCRWNGFEWYWSDHGRPTPEVAARSGVGAVAGPGSTRPYHVAVLGSDGGLWCRSMTGTTWSWTAHGTPGGQPVRAVAPPLLVPGAGVPQLQVAAWGLDGQVWVRVSDGASWRWDGRGSPPGVTTFGFVGAGVGPPPAGGQDGLVAFVISNDGILWGSWLDGAAPQWTSLGRPKAGLGAVAGIGVAPFVAAPDGPMELRVVVLDGTQRHLWVTTWPPSGPWTDVPPPAGVAVSGSLGVITDPDDAARSAVLVPGTDRHLWLLSLGAADHRWEDWGPLPTTGRVRGRAVDARVGNRSNPTHRSPAAPVCSDDGRLVISVRYPS
jgi:hypothetical protein